MGGLLLLLLLSSSMINQGFEIESSSVSAMVFHWVISFVILVKRGEATGKRVV